MKDNEVLNLKIKELENKVFNGEIKKYSNKKLFAGAHLVIQETYSINKEYPNGTVVVKTKNFKEISNLIYAFKDTFNDYIDGYNKYYCFESIGHALVDAQRRQGDSLNCLNTAVFKALQNMFLQNGGVA